MNDRILCSVLMITYNHEKYIAQAIDSVLMQRTNFDFEIVIGEDCSTDRTREIVLEYKAKHPDKIKLLLQEKNVGIHKNFTQTILSCKGKYIALLEGDDYWTDEYKLQRQVDFLENNPDFVLCFENTIDQNEISNENKISDPNFDVLVLKDLIRDGWFMRTGSIVFRNNVIKQFPEWYFKYRSTDYILHILLAQHGKIKFINQRSSVYRINEGGITQKDFKKDIISLYEENLKLLDFLNTFFNYNYRVEISIHKKSIYNAIVVSALNNLSIKNILKFFMYYPKCEKLKMLKRAINKFLSKINENNNKR